MTSPSSTNGRPPIPGCTDIREVAGFRVYRIGDADFLSTSSVIRMSPWGNVAHVPPPALAYGSARGSWVDTACRMVDDGTLDWEGTDWDQRYGALPMRVRPHVEAYAAWIADVKVLTTEELVLAPDLFTFGYRDRWVKHPKHGSVVVDIKTSKTITDRDKLQVSSYATNATDTMLLLQLTKEGKAIEHWVPDWLAYRQRFRTLAAEAHAWVVSQEARA